MPIAETNISLLNVASIVGEKYTENGTEYLDTRLSAVCTSDNINMFSKKKPLNTLYNPSTNDNWWKGNDGRCGIIINEYKTDEYFGEAYVKAAKDSWKFNKPLGSQGGPYRLSFFGGYEHHAAPCFSLNLDGSPLLVYMDKTTTLTIRATSNLNSSNTELRWSDFNANNFQLNKCYLGVYIVNRDKPTFKLMCTATSTIDSSDSEIVVKFNEGDTFLEGNYDIYFLLSSKIIRQGVNNQENDPDKQGIIYYPLYTGNLKNYPISMEYTTSFANNVALISVDEVATSDSYSTMSFQPISRYGGYGTEALWLNNYTLFKVTVKNRKNKAITFNNSELMIEVTNQWENIYDITSSQSSYNPYLYLMDDNLSQIDSISLDANEQIQIIIGITNLSAASGGDFVTDVWQLRFGTIPVGYTEGKFYPYLTQDLYVNV